MRVSNANQTCKRHIATALETRMASAGLEAVQKNLMGILLFLTNALGHGRRAHELCMCHLQGKVALNRIQNFMNVSLFILDCKAVKIYGTMKLLKLPTW